MRSKRGLKAFFILIIVIILAVSSSAAGIDFTHEFRDSKGDVLDVRGNPVDNPDIDIIFVETWAEGGYVHFRLEVDGEIRQSEEEYAYTFYAIEEKNKTIGEASGVMVYFSDNEAGYVLINDVEEYGEAEFDVDGGQMTISVNIDVFEFMEEFHIYVLTNYFTEFEDQRQTDNASSWEKPPPNDETPENYDPINGEENDNDTPWLGIIGTILALSFALLCKRKFGDKYDR